jgi:hypothetical protein
MLGTDRVAAGASAEAGHLMQARSPREQRHSNVSIPKLDSVARHPERPQEAKRRNRITNTKSPQQHATGSESEATMNRNHSQGRNAIYLEHAQPCAHAGHNRRAAAARCAVVREVHPLAKETEAVGETAAALRSYQQLQIVRCSTAE